MSGASVVEKPAAGAPGTRTRVRRSPGGTTLGQDVGRDARRLAAAILEVLAGARTPTEAAQALGLSLPRYYQLESRALRGLVATCEPRPKGRQRSVESEVAGLKREIERWRRDYNTIRPHSSLGYRPPAPEATQPWSSASATLQLQTTAEEQKQEAEASKARFEALGRYLRPIVTQIVPEAPFYRAEDYHQQYLKKRGLESCSTH